jgi:integrase
MTGCRLDEIEGLLKTEVNPVGMALRLGDSKTGKSIRPVGSAVIAVLKAAAEKSKSKYVFPAIITCHGLRHSFSSTAEDLGYSLMTIKALICHS